MRAIQFHPDRAAEVGKTRCKNATKSPNENPSGFLTRVLSFTNSLEGELTDARPL
jgi:hypothetical protein